MNNFNALKIYRLLLNIAWYSIIVMVLVFLIFNLFSLIAQGKMYVKPLISFPIEVELINVDFEKFKNSYNLNQTKPFSGTVKINEIAIRDFGSLFISTYYISSLIALGLAVYQLKLLRNLVDNVIDKNIFTVTNVRTLRQIGLIELAKIPLCILFYLVLSYSISNEGILDKSLAYSPDYFELFSSLPSALEYLIFAGIFSFGLKIKNEQDLTI